METSRARILENHAIGAVSMSFGRFLEALEDHLRLQRRPSEGQKRPLKAPWSALGHRCVKASLSGSKPTAPSDQTECFWRPKWKPFGVMFLIQFSSAFGTSLGADFGTIWVPKVDISRVVF